MWACLSVCLVFVYHCRFLERLEVLDLWGILVGELITGAGTLSWSSLLEQCVLLLPESSLQTTRRRVCGVFHTEQFFPSECRLPVLFSSRLTRLGSECGFPQVKSLVPQGCPTLHVLYTLRNLTRSNLHAKKPKNSHSPQPRLADLLVWLTELRGIRLAFSSLFKGCNMGTNNGREAWGQVLGARGWGWKLPSSNHGPFWLPAPPWLISSV